MKKVFELVVLFLMFFVPIVVWGVCRTYNSINFSIKCSDYIKRAADANTIEIASKELGTAVKYLEDNRITEGFTSVIYQSPEDDIGFLYNNLKSSLEELNKVTSETSQLEKTNILMKLRETLLDHRQHGDSVTRPDGISCFPNNKLYFWVGILSAIWAVIGVIALSVKANS